MENEHGKGGMIGQIESFDVDKSYLILREEEKQR